MFYIVYNHNMKKIIEFLKSNIIIAKWTFWYFFILWLILRFIFKFDMFSAQYWWKFFHATLHGFGGFVFGLLVYTAIPIYIATTSVIYRKKELVITIPFIDKIFPKKEKKEEQQETKEETDTKSTIEYPDDMPPELRVPYSRAKNHLSFVGTVSIYNKQKTEPKEQEEQPNISESEIPIPTDFDISDSLENNDDNIPTFTDINFDEPENEQLENKTTEYFKNKNTEFETYKQFVATNKYVIYEHSDNDFWIMDEKVWFAAGKQIDSPINELIELAKQNELEPVLYLESQNIMDIETTIKNFETAGVKVVKSLDELD